MDEVKNTPMLKFRLRTANHVLTVIAVLLGMYVIIAPFLPQTTWWVTEHTPLARVFDNSEEVQAASDAAPKTQNTLFIPALGLEEVVHEGGLEQLKNGVLRRSKTSTPEKGSNTVMVGHRFAYGERGVFYHLDKVNLGDAIVVHWQGVKYAYTVTEIVVVPPTQVSVEAPSDDDMLTLYTCTPLWTATDRLVIKAKVTVT